MGILNKIRRHTEDEPEPRACLHSALTAQWDRLEDMGHEDRATTWTCVSCNETFSADAGQALRESEAQRLKDALGASES